MNVIQTIQSAFGQATSAASLVVPLPTPTSTGNTLSIYLRFSPLTGTPMLSDNFGNRYRLTGSNMLSATQAVSFWTAEIIRGGAGHTVTATSQGGLQSLEIGVSELSLLSLDPGHEANDQDILYAILVQSFQQTALLQRLVTAERA